MSKYHVNPKNGNVGVCRATEGNCPLGGNEVHGGSIADAAKAYEQYVATDGDPATNTFSSLRKEKQENLGDLAGPTAGPPPEQAHPLPPQEEDLTHKIAYDLRYNGSATTLHNVELALRTERMSRYSPEEAREIYASIAKMQGIKPYFPGEPTKAPREGIDSERGHSHQEQLAANMEKAKIRELQGKLPAQRTTFVEAGGRMLEAKRSFMAGHGSLAKYQEALNERIRAAEAYKSSLRELQYSDKERAAAYYDEFASTRLKEANEKRDFMKLAYEKANNSFNQVFRRRAIDAAEREYLSAVQEAESAGAAVAASNRSSNPNFHTPGA